MLDAEDKELIRVARETIRARHRSGWHHTACAVRTRSGRIHTGVHLDSNTGSVSVCAEAVALGRAVTEGDPEIVTMVSVRHPARIRTEDDIAVVPPCGVCREMLNDYAPTAAIIVPTEGGLTKVAAGDLLPLRHT